MVADDKEELKSEKAGTEQRKMDGRIVEMGPESRDAQITRASVVGIISNVLLAGFKAAVGLFTNSIAITLDAVNNVSDVASSVITIVGTKLARKEPDRKHPYGHGRIEYVTTVIVAAIVLWAGITSLQESITRIVNPQVASYDAVSLIIVAVAVVVKIFLGLYTRRVGHRVNSGTLLASGTDALTDSVLSAATLVAALIFVFSGLSLEAWLGLIISGVIIKAGIDMLREVLSKIIGERIDPEKTTAVKKSVCSVEGVDGAYDLILADYGPDVLWGSVHIEVPDSMTAREIDELTRKIQTVVYENDQVILHTVGIYSQNASGGIAGKIRRDVFDIAGANNFVLEVHGFYLDERTNDVRFDLVVSFDAPDRQEVVDKIKSILEGRYPQYRFSVALDSDIAD